MSYLSVSGFSLCVSGSVVSLSGQTYGLHDKVLEDSPQYYELGYHNQFVFSNRFPYKHASWNNEPVSPDYTLSKCMRYY